jgi:hypothetical protein
MEIASIPANLPEHGCFRDGIEYRESNTAPIRRPYDISHYPTGGNSSDIGVRAQIANSYRGFLYGVGDGAAVWRHSGIPAYLGNLLHETFLTPPYEK